VIADTVFQAIINVVRIECRESMVWRAWWTYDVTSRDF
jgi:hypothetical protein